MSVHRDEEKKVILEYFDLSDYETLDVLTSVNEADKGQILTSLTSKLYSNIVSKIDDIDFGTIPNSRGDITAIENYQQLNECLNIMLQLVSEYRQNPAAIKTVIDAVENIKARKNIFSKAYTLGVEFPIVIYNTMTLACVSSVSFLITSCIEFIKNDSAQSYEIALDTTAYRKSKDALLLKSLEDFNKLCRNRTLDKSMEDIINQSRKNFAGTAVAATILGALSMGSIAIGLIKFVLPMLQQTVYFLFHTQQKVSDFFDVQADLLQTNAQSLQYRTNISPQEREAIYSDQMAIVNRFRKYSDQFNINRKKSENNVQNDIRQEKRKYTISDVVEELPPSAEVPSYEEEPVIPRYNAPATPGGSLF